MMADNLAIELPSDLCVSFCVMGLVRLVVMFRVTVRFVHIVKNMVSAMVGLIFF